VRAAGPPRNDEPVREYLIRTAGTHEFPGVARNQEAEVLLPGGFGCERIDGQAEFAMLCRGTQITVCPEFPGWQVAIEGPMPDAECEDLVAALTRQIEVAAGQPCEWFQFT
jgi:hypothetical protein